MIDTEGLSVSGHIFKRMMQGEALVAKEVAVEYGVSESLLTMIVHKAKKAGVVFESNGSAKLISDPNNPKVIKFFESMKKEPATSRLGRFLEAHPGRSFSIEELRQEMSDLKRGAVRNAVSALLQNKCRAEWQNKLVAVEGERGVYQWGETKKASRRGNGTRGNGEEPFVATVVEFLKNHSDQAFNVAQVVDGLGQSNPDVVRSTMSNVVRGVCQPQYRGVVRVRPGFYRWVGLKAAARINGKPAANERAAGANGKAKKRSQAIEPTGTAQGSSQPLSALLGFDTGGAPVVPALGSSVRVVGSMLDEDDGDNVKLLLRNATGTWITEVAGVSGVAGGS